MTTVLSHEILSYNDRVLHVTLDTPASTPFTALVNLDLLTQEMIAVLSEGRLIGISQTTEQNPIVYGLNVVFVSPPSESEQNTAVGKVAAHNPAGHTPEQQAIIDRGVDWAELRAQAVAMIQQGDAALTAIDANLATVTTIENNVIAATALGQFKTALAPLPNVLRGILNRQAGIITNFQRVLKALRWLVPGD